MRSCEPLLNWTKTGTNGALNILNALFRPDAVVTPLCCFPCGYSRGRLLDRLYRFKAYIHFSCFCWAGTHQIFIWQNPNLLCRSLWSVPCLAPHGNRVQGLPRLWSCGELVACQKSDRNVTIRLSQIHMSDHHSGSPVPYEALPAC